MVSPNTRQFSLRVNKLSPGAGMNSSKENTSSCRRIACNVHLIHNVATPEYNWAAKHIITQCPFKQPTDSVLWAPFTYLKWQCKKVENNWWFPEKVQLREMNVILVERICKIIYGQISEYHSYLHVENTTRHITVRKILEMKQLKGGKQT